MENAVLAQRIFTQEDQLRFARLSGDYNPMHLDAVSARRTQAGAPVAHGVHLLLWALDALAAKAVDLPPMHSLRARFNKFVFVDEPAEVFLKELGPDSARLYVTAGGAAVTQINIALGQGSATPVDMSAYSQNSIPLPPQPLDPAFESTVNLSGRLPFACPAEASAGMFPAASKWLGSRRLTAFAASSCLVGMIVPGLHSIFGELIVEVCEEATPEAALAFLVFEADPRLRLIRQTIAGGGIKGSIKCMMRTPPVLQPTMESMRSLVDPAEFAGSTALVVGGSRGLGEVTAKLVAAGGCHAIVTWHSGKEDATRVCDEIRAAGGSAETLQYDCLKPAEEQLQMLSSTPQCVYYFATPTIFRGQSDVFSATRLEQFLRTYVHGFWELAQVLRARCANVTLFYPSSVAVSERPRGMTEYAMAKSAGEILCEDMNKALAPLHVIVNRLPRLSTDQTSSLTAAKTASTVETMLPIVNEVQTWARGPN